VWIYMVSLLSDWEDVWKARGLVVLLSFFFLRGGGGQAGGGGLVRGFHGGSSVK
jgi:hypothetical protein